MTIIAVNSVATVPTVRAAVTSAGGLTLPDIIVVAAPFAPAGPTIAGTS